MAVGHVVHIVFIVRLFVLLFNEFVRQNRLIFSCRLNSLEWVRESFLSIPVERFVILYA